MRNTLPGVEDELMQLRAEVARLRRTLVGGFVAMAVILLVLYAAPWLGLLAMGLALLVVVVGTIGAGLGTITGRVIRATRKALQRG
jgi:hypothetical protein